LRGQRSPLYLLGQELLLASGRLDHIAIWSVNVRQAKFGSRDCTRFQCGGGEKTFGFLAGRGLAAVEAARFGGMSVEIDEGRGLDTAEDALGIRDGRAMTRGVSRWKPE